MSITLSLVVPFYNEKNIIKNYQKLINFLEKNFPDSELILVNDGSAKEFVNPLKNVIAQNKRVKLISYSKNQGRGYALKKSFLKAKGQYLAYIDADLEISPIYFKKIIPLLKKYDVAIASKLHPQSKITTLLIRHLASLIYNSTARLILQTKIADHGAGLKGFRRQVIKSTLNQVKENQWLFDVELLYLIRKKGYRIIEVPIQISYGFGKIRKSFITNFLKIFIAVFLIKWRHRSI